MRMDAASYKLAFTDEQLAMLCAHYDKRIDELAAENAKLRELLTDLAVCACGKYCYGCPHQYDGCDRDERLRELLIEVIE